MNSRGIYALVGAFVLGNLLMMSVWLYLGGEALQDPKGIDRRGNMVFSRSPPASRAAEREERSLWGHLSHLVLVAGHAVYTHEDFEDKDLRTDAAWFLEEYQKGQVETLVEHIQEGVRLTGEDKNALLVFSGGETRFSAGPRSEAQSYWMVAEHSSWFGQDPEDLRVRSTTEEFARDSFENLLFGVCRFRELTGRYPDNITVVGFEFKRARFEELHREAIEFPPERFSYLGIDPPVSPARLEDIRRAELANSVAPFREDPYGCGKVLMRKKQTRNPFHRSHGYLMGCPEIQKLLSYCGPEPFPLDLPWAHRSPQSSRLSF